ncbi:MAG TPA: FAD-dependent oxidoreductase [Candidatus Moranbacteria bacterium]|nr:FAD-dependent oxidoreductase [Candidatus Moranbacteria bacterium]
MKTYQVSLRERRSAAENTPLLVFDKPAGFDFQAGQFVILQIPSPAFTDERGDKRPLSIASAPSDDFLEFSWRKSPSAFKRSAECLAVGDPVLLTGPCGPMHLPPEETPAVFFAGGIGITPVRSMLREEAARGSRRPVSLFYSNRDRQSAPFLSEMEELCAKLKGELISVFTDDGTDPRLIDAEFIARNLSSQNRKNAWFFLSGTAGFVEAMRRALLSLSIEEKRIFSDSFGSPPAAEKGTCS